MKRILSFFGLLSSALCLNIQASLFTNLSVNTDNKLQFDFIVDTTNEPWFIDSAPRAIYMGSWNLLFSCTNSVSAEGRRTDNGRWPYIYRAHLGYPTYFGFSQNAVGNYRQTVLSSPGYHMPFANQFDRGNNMVSQIFSNAPNRTKIYKFLNASNCWTSALKVSDNLWIKDFLADPGIGLLIEAPGEFMAITYGNVRNGWLTNSLLAGYNMVASQVPEYVNATDLPLQNGDKVYQYAYTFDGVITEYLYQNGQFFVDVYGSGDWQPTDPPVFRFAESFMIYKTAPTNWLQHVDLWDPNIPDYH
jgi:hypothetical protein